MGRGQSLVAALGVGFGGFGLRFRGLAFGVRGFEVWSFGFGDLRFEVWGFGFGIVGLGVGHQLEWLKVWGLGISLGG